MIRAVPEAVHASAGASSPRGAAQPAGEDAGGAYGEVVLGAEAAEDVREPGGRPLVRVRGQVDEAAPAAGEFEGGGTAEAPDGCLGEGGEPVGAAGGHRAAGSGPEHGVHVGVAQRLDEGEGGGEPGGQRRVLGVRPLVQGEQREHSGGRVGVRQRLADPLGEGGAVVGRGVHRQAADGDPARGQGPRGGDGPRVVGVGRRGRRGASARTAARARRR
ncbi:hypothetical protein [Streptomyces lavendulae]